MIIYKKSDYQNNQIYVGRHKDEEGNPLVVANGIAIAPARLLLESLLQWQAESTEKSAIAVLRAEVNTLANAVAALQANQLATLQPSDIDAPNITAAVIKAIRLIESSGIR